MWMCVFEEDSLTYWSINTRKASFKSEVGHAVCAKVEETILCLSSSRSSSETNVGILKQSTVDVRFYIL